MTEVMRIVLLIALAVQVGWRVDDPARAVRTFEVPQAPSLTTLRTLSLGDPVPLSQVVALFLQGTDREEGSSAPLARLDYERTEAWLTRLLQLDPASGYALMLATHVYAQAADPMKQRRMLDFAYHAYRSDPGRRWRWLAHASLIARHRLNDLDLALQYANALGSIGRDEGVPIWAQQLRALIVEERGEYESARIFVGGLLASGRVTDAQEVRFLSSEIARLAAIDGHSPALAK